MPDFNAYHQWLAIPPSEQPPNYYRLLGVSTFEADSNVIDVATNQRMAYLHTCSTGERAELAEQLMNEVTEARLCLLDQRRKDAYDQRLRKKESATETPATPPALPKTIAASDTSARKKARRNQAVKSSRSTASGRPGSPRLKAKAIRQESQNQASENSTPDKMYSASMVWFIVGSAVLVLALIVGGIYLISSRETELAGDSDGDRTKKSGEGDVPSPPAPEITDSIGMELVLIPAGSFQMGADQANRNAYRDEKPQHLVTISQPFYMGKLEVTQAQWKELMLTNPASTLGESNPVQSVSWDEANEFCRRLSGKEGVEYRLPTEAEWEFACRARSQTTWSWGDSSESISEYAWCNENSANTQACARKAANAFGLHDMHGNVAEWCQDWYDEYKEYLDQTTDPVGPSSSYNDNRVFRGGHYSATATQCTCSYRGSGKPTLRQKHIGFRVVRVIPQGRQPTTSTKKKDEPDQEIQNAAGMSFVLIPSGTFTMGSPVTSGYDDEKPAHPVTFSRPFYMGKYEVTVDEFVQIMNRNPSTASDLEAPVNKITHEEAREFCRRLGSVDGHRYRLPTEAEWEYACRARTNSDWSWSFGDELDSANAFVWYAFNSSDGPKAVGTRRANPFGLYDMHGNVSEWCQDWYDDDYYSISPSNDPQGPTSPSLGRPRVVRGGSFADLANSCRSAFRHTCTETSKSLRIGFRVVREIE